MYVMMNWHFVTSAEYAAGNKVDGDLYYLSDTHEVYRGTESFTQSVAIYETTLPTPGAKNRLYIEKTTLAGWMTNDGSTWTQVVKPVDGTVTTDGKNPVSGAAVASYVAAELGKMASSKDTIKDITYDKAEHLVTLTKGDDSQTTILLDGLGCSLSFAENKLQLLDASGNKIGTEINMDVERFVQSGEYDPATKTIILYFNAEKTDKVSIPVGDLVDEYTVESSEAIKLEMLSNKIKASLIVSPDADNAAEVRANGLYVPKVDTSDLMPKVLGATEGHIPALAADGTLTDSGVSIAEAGKHKVYQVNSEAEREAIKDMKDGDFCIVSTMIHDGVDVDRVSRTAYIYSTNVWVAFDGNVSADNVYFPADLSTNFAIGKVKLTNGQATVPSAGKNLTETWKAIFQEYKAPVTTQPSVRWVTPTGNKVLEVGTSHTPSFSVDLNKGSYSYDANTGVTETSWSITDTNQNSADTKTGSFPAFTVEDSTNYKMTAVCQHSEGNIPHANDNTEYAAGQIKAGSKSATSATVTGYRAVFYGTVETKGEITSDVIRKLAGKTTSASRKGTVLNMPIPVKAQRVIIAYPATIGDIGSVLDVNGMNAEIKTAFAAQTVNVEGANAFTAIPYKVYVLDFAAANDTANTYKVTL